MAITNPKAIQWYLSGIFIKTINSIYIHNNPVVALFNTMMFYARYT